MKKKERRPKEMGSQWLNAMCEVLKGGVLAGVVTILVLLICAVLVSVGLVPVEAMYGTVLAACALGAFAGGIYAVRHVEGRSLLAGLGVGVVLFYRLSGGIRCQRRGGNPVRLPVRRGNSRTAGKKAQEKTQKMIEISRALCYNTSTMAENAVSKPNRRRN